MAVDHIDQYALKTRYPGGHQRAMRQINRDLVLPRKARYTADMIIMLVRNNDAVDIFGNQIEPLQSPRGICQAKTTIQQQARTTRLDDESVTFAAAAQ